RTSLPWGLGVSFSAFCSGLPCSTISQLSMSSSLKFSRLRRVGQRLVDGPEDVVERLEADRHAHHVGRDAGLDLVGFLHLAVRGRGGMDDQGLGVADVSEVAHELRRLDEALARFGAALDAEIEETGRAFRQIFFC